jgi:hypothetical protein
MMRWSEKLLQFVEVPEIDAFINDIIEVYKKHNMSISHEDYDGSFLIENIDNKNIYWLTEAADSRK